MININAGSEIKQDAAQIIENLFVRHTPEKNPPEGAWCLLCMDWNQPCVGKWVNGFFCGAKEYSINLDQIKHWIDISSLISPQSLTPIEYTRDNIIRVFKEDFTGCEVIVAHCEEDELLHFLLVWDGFEKLNSIQQHLLAGSSAREYGRARITCYTPQEYAKITSWRVGREKGEL